MQNFHFSSLYNPIKKCFPPAGYKVWNVYLQNCVERTGAGDVRSVLTLWVFIHYGNDKIELSEGMEGHDHCQEYNTEVYWHSPRTVHTNHKRKYRQDSLAKRSCSTLNTISHTRTNCIYRLLCEIQVHGLHFWVTGTLFKGIQFRKMCSINLIALVVV